MSEEEGEHALYQLGVGGGVTGMVGAVLFMVIKLIKKKGCTCKLYNCSGNELMEIDCEEGAPAARYKPKRQSMVAATMAAFGTYKEARKRPPVGEPAAPPPRQEPSPPKVVIKDESSSNNTDMD